MRWERGIALAGVAAAWLACVPVAGAQVQPAGQNDFGGFRNVLAVGQGETVSTDEFASTAGQGPGSFTTQLPLYRDLLYAEPTLKPSDLNTYFKSAGFGVPAQEVESTVTPRPGVAIVRDRTHRVPHVYGTTRADTMFGAGYASAQDRLFLMDVLRHTGRARLTELIGPGDDDSTVRMDAEQLKIADYSEAELQAMIDTAAAAAGAEGAEVKQDLLDYVAGVNEYIRRARTGQEELPFEYAALGKSPADWKPTDTVAVASLIGGIFGRGGGSEALLSQVLRQAQKRFGGRTGRRVFADFRRQDDPEAPVTTTRRFRFPDPPRQDGRGAAVPDLGSIRDRDPVVDDSGGGGGGGGGLPLRLARSLSANRHQSNALLIPRRESRSGRPIAVMGPQVGYYSPEILMELDLHGPGIDVRGASFPGVSLYVLLGRGRDFAWSATTATTDVVDEYVEKLCEPDGSRPSIDSNHYLYRGRCQPLVQRDHVITVTPPPTSPTPPRRITMRVERSVHGPIQARATVGGDPVAIAEARSTYFHELESALAFKRLNFNEVDDIGSFQRTMATINFAFNWFYVDDRDVGWVQSGWYPIRARGTDPSLPTLGTGAYDWRGFRPAEYSSRRASYKQLPKDANPRRGYVVNWNNKQAPGWRAADDVLVYSSVHRSERLEDRVRAGVRGRRKLTLTRLVQIMESAATVDLRGQEVYPVLRRVIGNSRDPALREPLRLLDEWRRGGSHRRDLDRDNVLDQSAAVALMDAWWPGLVRGIFQPRLGVQLIDRITALAEFGSPPPPGGSAFFTGWWGYVDKDLRRVLGQRVRQPLSRRYCGGGRLARCRTLIAGSLKDAAQQVAERYGSLSAVRIPATCGDDEQGAPGRRRGCDQIEFTTAGAVGTDPIHWQDRPTFQQVVQVQGHRPR